MRFFLAILFLASSSFMHAAWTKETLGKYQKLSINLSELCKKQESEKELIRSIRKAGGFRATKRPAFVKTNTINFPQGVRLRILKDGNWELMSEERGTGLDFFKTEHYASTSDNQLFAFVNAKLLDPASITKSERPTLVVFTPNKVIVVSTEDKSYCLLNRPDFEFAAIKYKNK